MTRKPRSSRLLLFTATFAIVAVAGGTGVGPPCVQSDPVGWSDLLGPRGDPLEAWTREPIPAGGDLARESPWKLDPESGVLTAKSPGRKREWLRFDQVLLDFALQIEWRVVPGGLPSRRPARGCIYVRNSNDAGMWHAATIGDLRSGYLVGSTFANHVASPFDLSSESKRLVKPEGEWNTYELICKGRSVSFRVNGGIANEWNGCGVPRGYLGLEVEDGVVEFRNLKLKPL